LRIWYSETFNLRAIWPLMNSFSGSSSNLFRSLNMEHVCLWFLVFNPTFNNMSDTSWAFFVEETGLPEENHLSSASHWQTVSHNVVSNTPRHEQGSNSRCYVVIGTYCTYNCIFNYNTIVTTTTLCLMDVFFNKQSGLLWVLNVFHFTPTCSFIWMSQT
jgi:hypothetical protein